jgi:ABC-type bacteriocin/lantibiotic exporter with double-glycine peptidase domain
MAAAGIIAAVLAAAIPIATSNVVGFVLPRDDRSALAGTTALLVALLLGTLVAGVAQGIALLRLATRLDLRLTAAIWDRALHLSPSFFRRFAAGELGRRLLAIDELRQLVTGATVAAGAAALFGFASLVVMVVYAPLLGLVTLGVVALAGVLVAMWLRRERRDVREMLAHRNAIAGMLLGMLSGIAKIRVAGAERRAQAAWARRFARQALAERRSIHRQVQIAAVAAALPAAVTFAAIGVAVGQGNEISPSSLAGFATALGQFSAAVLLVVPLAQTLLAAGPIYDTARPVLAEVPETSDAAADPGRLDGEVELASVTFRYGPDAPPALDGVSLAARPGEFVAIVGPSGSGKSTLVRILLGFDVPESGSVLLDGRELEGLDLQAVRRQMGTVIQGAGLSPGTIGTNITGASVLEEEAVWRAIDRVGLSADVRRMPMGLHTLVSEGGAGFSGGQAQRILLARALVRDPRIVILDEATAYLDNETQRQVTETLADLGATRIVIAHRLSTIRGADRIYVMEGGRVVEQGTHDELLAAGGPFARLARRQMIEAAPGD